MSRPIKVWYQCEGCGTEFEVSVEPIIPGNVCGPPESCYPEEGGEIDPEECLACKTPIPIEEVHANLPTHDIGPDYDL